VDSRVKLDRECLTCIERLDGLITYQLSARPPARAKSPSSGHQFLPQRTAHGARFGDFAHARCGSIDWRVWLPTNGQPGCFTFVFLGAGGRFPKARRRGRV